MYQVSIRNQSCPNTNCKFFGEELAGNIISHAKAYPRFKCKECCKTWVANRYNKSYRLRRPIEEFEEVKLSLGEGISIRQIAASSGISPATVQRWKARI